MKAAAIVPPELRPYVTYSLAFHLALAAVVFGFLPLGGRHAPANVYTIDFVGPSAAIVTAGGASSAAAVRAAPASERPAPQRQVDDFGRHVRKGHFVLPRPSLLKGYQAPKEDQQAQSAVSEEKPAAQPSGAEGAAAAGAAAAGAGSAGDAGVSADMPNFPYPWYITQVRQALWNVWSRRMPGGGGESLVMFSILPNGGVVDLRTEISSGDSAFDLAALAAVQDAAPFPPLPKEFTEPFLKIHVTLKSR